MVLIVITNLTIVVSYNERLLIIEEKTEKSINLRYRHNLNRDNVRESRLPHISSGKIYH